MEQQLFRLKKNLQKLIKKNSHILVAFSGGKDSVCLLNLLLNIKKEFNLKISVAYINHNLRGAESDEEEEFVTNYINSLNISLYKKVIQKEYWASLKKKSVEMEARKIRYDFFYKIANQNYIDYIATAHHLNDKIETFFIQILRAGGIETLTSIPTKNDKIIRPIINFSKKEIESYIEENKLKYIEDSTNNENLYKRNIIRNKIVPLLKEINPNFEKTFLKLFSNLDEEVYFYKKIINKFYKGILISKNNGFIVIDKERYDGFDVALKKNIIKLILKKLDFPTKPDKVLFGETCSQKSKYLYKKGDFLVKSIGNMLWLINLSKIKSFDKNITIESFPFHSQYLDIQIKNTNEVNPKNNFCIKFDENDLPIKVRQIKNADTFEFDKNKNKSLVKLIKEMRIHTCLFNQIFVFENSIGKIIGFWLNNKFFRVSKIFYIEKNKNCLIFDFKSPFNDKTNK
ncbi:MAG: tRNA lysidine(34) synthetase TilS [Spirochaetes bacterium GWD1_27_9]|nr:MAG: tRNA lysidine(34) synthetase TilS [Spirochaetes bacterium GWB1_27_13]OHD38634.1 MAG: tRNA lysidine(34) synthetase TilS [Spirochaetes bacterium GWD1_27_9]